jgi:hypothetical protein
VVAVSVQVPARPEIAQAMLRQQQATQQVVNTGSLYQ